MRDLSWHETAVSAGSAGGVVGCHATMGMWGAALGSFVGATLVIFRSPAIGVGGGALVAGGFTALGSSLFCSDPTPEADTE